MAITFNGNGTVTGITTLPDGIVTNDDLAGSIAEGKLAGSIPDSKIVGLSANKLSGVVPTANLGTGTASASTFLNGSGAYSAAGGGKVLQAVTTSITSTTITTTSASLVDISGFAATITPAATSSKVLCLVNMFIGSSYQHHRAASLLRTSTVIGNISLYVGGSDLSSHLSSQSLTILDSPNTASAVTYKMQWIAYVSGTRYLNKNAAGTFTAVPSTITLIEIGA